MKRPLLAILLLSVALLACATTATVAEVPAQTPTLALKSIAPVAILKGDWVCRTEPTEASSRCGWFLDGQKVTVSEKYRGWVLVPNRGWVCGRGLPSLDVKECE